MKERLTERVYRSLKEDVLNARYSPNQMIVERDIAAKYGVSKQTASEALHRLCSEGHLTSHPRSGYTVTMLSSKELAQIKRLRFVLESLVIDIVCAEAADDDISGLFDLIDGEYEEGLTAATINARFHLGLAGLTGDKYLISALTDLIGALSRVETVISPMYRDKWREYHRNIVDAVLARNTEEAKKHLRDDLNQ